MIGVRSGDAVFLVVAFPPLTPCDVAGCFLGPNVLGQRQVASYYTGAALAVAGTAAGWIGGGHMVLD